MILNDFGQEKLDLIENLLIQYDESTGIETRDVFRREFEATWLYQFNTWCLPFQVIDATELIMLDKTYFQIYYNGIREKHPTLVSDGIENTINRRFKESIPWEDISTAILDRVTSLIWRYDQVLNATREIDKLCGIHDEEKILINHFNLYQTILNSEDKQIEFFEGICLTKEISDTLLAIYLEFIERRLSLLNPQLNSKSNIGTNTSQISNRKFSKLIWNGNQKQLLELILTLQEKGWIDEFKKRELTRVSNSICQLFDLTKTQSIEGSDTSNSFNQILKGEYDPLNETRSYGNIFGDGYEKSFSKILKVKS